MFSEPKKGGGMVYMTRQSWGYFWVQWGRIFALKTHSENPYRGSFLKVNMAGSYRMGVKMKEWGEPGIGSKGSPLSALSTRLFSFSIQACFLLENALLNWSEVVSILMRNLMQYFILNIIKLGIKSFPKSIFPWSQVPFVICSHIPAGRPLYSDSHGQLGGCRVFFTLHFPLSPEAEGPRQKTNAPRS